ncbi:transporter [Mycolicibacterium phlei]|jgi:RND superfamily putative drug exporter|uniref:Membrane protein n=1 Tax=Mycolicibacterium phlei DSM 43239 = CCUG 21000 TaxID=1226750 RepID=A0A5N5US89_MYCPH|nr:MMPL family transporter [Mycolicibacterium phlei]VEG09404.1 transporter [Mycobacteroides chelonae]AMO61290.1 Membrane transport protein mmpL8 [Mycolicibacterium phlei]EID14134.1 transporter [Mycolicibacterium phlei RIVM601174]KAB7752471.1 membrane protein [Mycolicibacterium phlei DSM 43239 = CCUG 21000]KXW60818.1 membrane protein [Mycolicibacterium phlei DSM 43239 = CCUG 21000]
MSILAKHTREARTDAIPAARHVKRPRIARFIRRFAVPIIIFWVAVIAFLNTSVPTLEDVGELRSVSMSPTDAPSYIATKRVGKVFEEYDTSSSVMVVLEGDDPLGADAHVYYDELVRRMRADTQHVQHVQDFWGDTLTAAGAQSVDGKAAYVQVYIAGDQGQALANESVEAIGKIIEELKAPPGVQAYVTGPAATSANQREIGDASMKTIEALTFAIIIVMLLLVYRSVTTVAITMGLVMAGLMSARGIVAFLGYHEVFGLTTFASNMVVTLAIAAATDYAIFLIGRYHEARRNGEDRESAYYTMFSGTAHVVLASGMTIAGATMCLYFTRLPYFQTMGIPVAVGMTIVVAAGLTLGPAVITVATRFGKLLEPKRWKRPRGWRRIGAACVRWPGAVLVLAIVLALVGLLTLPGYHTVYNDRIYLPDDASANVGYAAADRHFSDAKMNPDLVMVEADHDLRNPADFLVIDKIAKAMQNVHGIAQVTTITRPDGKPIEHASLAYTLSQSGTTQLMNNDNQQAVLENILKQADDLQVSIDAMEKMYDVTLQLAEVSGSMAAKMEGTSGNLDEVRDHLADFDDQFRPLRNYFYWEPHCYDIPMCWSLRSIFDSLDGVSQMSLDFADMVPDMKRMAELTPQMAAVMPAQIQTLKNQKQLILNQYQAQKAQQDQAIALQENATAMGQAFDQARNDDTFYLPPEAFETADFKRGMELFLSPDGRAVKFTVVHQGDPLTEEGTARIEPLRIAAADAIKNTPLEGSTIWVGGSAATYKDMQQGADYDLLIAATAALILIFIIMVVLTRAIAAAAVIVGTVVLSLGTSFGLSVLLWQHLIGIPLHWMVLPMAVIVLLAVGADYNLLLVSRMKEELHAGLNTGIIRSMAGTGSVVTSAGLVFAFTMAGMAVSQMIVIGQVGTTIGLGLLFDTLVVRSLMTPSVAALLGRWFWWPQRVRQRPVPKPWPKPAAEPAEV